MKQLMIWCTFLALAFCASAEDLVVEKGQTLEITAAASYGSVTVNGTLIVKAALTFTELYIADGVDAEAEVTVSGSGSLGQSNSGDQCVYVGYNGGKGKLTFSHTGAGFAIATLVLGHGGGADCEIALNTSKFVQGWSIKKVGAGTGHVTFNGGYFKLSQDFLVIEEGKLTVDSVNGKSIAFRPFNKGDKCFASGNGSLETSGTGSLSLCNSIASTYSANAKVLLQGPKGGLTMGHTGGLEISDGAGAQATFKLMQDDFIDDVQHDVQLNSNQILDLNGHKMTAKSLGMWGSTTGFEIVNSADAEAVLETSGSIDSRFSIGGNIRLKKVGATVMTYGGSVLNGSLEVAEGSFLAAKDLLVRGNVLQTGSGKISIPSGKTLTFSGGKWTAPAFADDSAGTVVFDTDGRSVMDVTAVNFARDIKVAGGELVIGKLATSSAHRYFRLTFLDNYNDSRSIPAPSAPKDILVLGEFSLLDAENNRLNANLKAAPAGTAAKDLAPGECCYAAAYAEGVPNKGSAVANLFDTYTSSCVYFTGLGWVEGSAANAPRTILMHLADAQTAEVVRYQLYTSNGTYDNGSGGTAALVPAGNATKWTLEGSEDGIHWQTLDVREQRASADQTVKSNTGYAKGPYSLSSDFVKAAESVTFSNGAGVVVVPGATLNIAAETCEIASIGTDCGVAGVGSLSGFSFAADGRLSLTNAPTSFDRLTIPLAFDEVTGLDDFRKWSVYVDGVKVDNSKIKYVGGQWVLSRNRGAWLFIR